MGAEHSGRLFHLNIRTSAHEEWCCRNLPTQMTPVRY